jgi:triphosphatase
MAAEKNRPNFEIELKLAINRDDISAFRKLPLLREKSLGRPVRRRVFNLYFDTPDLALKKRAMALRLRKMGNVWLQTLKTAGETDGGLHTRSEWEHRLRAPELDLSLFRDTPLAELPRRDELHLVLRPAFATDFYRTTWLVETAPHQRVEIALDQGFIRFDHHETAISEVEIELIEGDIATVFDVASQLNSSIALRPDMTSKAERGYRLFQSAPLTPRRATEIPLKRKWTPEQAARAVFASCLAHLQSNVEGALLTDDPEFIHQLRVALRRMRSAIRVFKPADADFIVAELKWLTGALGTARDWDVLVTESLPALLEEYEDRALAAQLRANAKRQQADARSGARAALASPRYARLALAIARWINVPDALSLSLSPSLSPPQQTAANDTAPEFHEADGRGEGDSAPPSLGKFARRKLRRFYRRLMRADAPLTTLSIETRHQVRIDAKRLRYAIEFFADLFEKDRVADSTSALRKILDILGAANDAAVAMDLVERLAPPEAFAAFARGWFAANRKANLADVDRELNALRDVARF